MTLELVADALGDVRNARFLATASDLAYLSAAEGVPQFREKLGLDAKLIGFDNTQVYVGCDAKNIVVAFRGTEDPTSAHRASAGRCPPPRARRSSDRARRPGPA